MPLAVVVARKVKGTAAAGIDRVGRVLEVPGAEVAVVEEESPAVRGVGDVLVDDPAHTGDRKSTRLNSSHLVISYAVFCLKKKKKTPDPSVRTNTRSKMRHP